MKYKDKLNSNVRLARRKLIELSQDAADYNDSLMLDEMINQFDAQFTPSIERILINMSMDIQALGANAHYIGQKLKGPSATYKKLKDLLDELNDTVEVLEKEIT